MKTYLFDTLERYKRFSDSLDVKTIICNKSWSVFNDSGVKEVYIFQEDNSLIISNDGKVTNGTWKYIPANKSIIIDGKGQSYMLHPAFIDEIIFALQVDGTQQCAFLIDESNKESFDPKSYSELLQYFHSKEQVAIEHQNEEIERIKNDESLIEVIRRVNNPLDYISEEQIVFRSFKEVRVKIGDSFIDIPTGNKYLEEYEEFPLIKKTLRRKRYYLWKNLRIVCSWITFIGLSLFGLLCLLVIVDEVLKLFGIDFNLGDTPMSEIPMIGKALLIFGFTLMPLGLFCWMFKDMYLKGKQQNAFIKAEVELDFDIPQSTSEEYVNRGFE